MNGSLSGIYEIGVIAVFGVVSTVAAGICLQGITEGWRESERRLMGYALLAYLLIPLWPVMPLVFGAFFLHSARPEGQATTRADRRRAREIEAADHALRLAQYRAQETRLLEEAAGIKEES